MNVFQMMIGSMKDMTTKKMGNYHGDQCVIGEIIINTSSPAK
jgi:hypothetical protein